MYLLYTINLNGDIYKRKIVKGEKASLKYLNYLEEKGKEEFLKFHGLKVKSKMNYLKFSFVNDNYENEKLYKIYEKYYWNEIKEHNNYDLKNIQDYYFRDIVVICLKDEITDLEYITKMIKQIKKDYENEKEKMD